MSLFICSYYILSVSHLFVIKTLLRAIYSNRNHQFSSAQFSCSVMSDSLRLHESQHAKSTFLPHSFPQLCDTAQPPWQHLFSQLEKPKSSISMVSFHSRKSPRVPGTLSFFKRKKIYISLSTEKTLSCSAHSFPLVISPLLPLKCHVRNSKPGLDLSWNV